MTSSRKNRHIFIIASLILTMSCTLRGDEEKEQDPSMSRRLLLEVIGHVRSKVLYIGHFQRTVPETDEYKNENSDGSYSYSKTTQVRYKRSSGSGKASLEELEGVDDNYIKDIVVLERGLEEAVEQDGQLNYDDRQEFYDEVRNLEGSNAAEQLKNALQECLDVTCASYNNLQQYADDLNEGMSNEESSIYRALDSGNVLEVGEDKDKEDVSGILSGMGMSFWR